MEDGQERSLAEVGRVLGVSRERARQVEAAALAKLRRMGPKALMAVAAPRPPRGATPAPPPPPPTHRGPLLGGAPGAFSAPGGGLTPPAGGAQKGGPVSQLAPPAEGPPAP